MAEAEQKMRVLIVDDDQTLCDMYSERLKAEGFDVVVAHNGEEGAAKAVEYLPDVILLDLMMPKVNGFNTLEILKSTQETKDIPVLLLTALIQEENKKRGIQAGAEDYIIKSETMPGAVIEKIKSVVQKHRQGQQSAAGTAATPPQQAPTPPQSSVYEPSSISGQMPPVSAPQPEASTQAPMPAPEPMPTAPPPPPQTNMPQPPMPPAPSGEAGNNTPPPPPPPPPPPVQ